MSQDGTLSPDRDDTGADAATVQVFVSDPGNRRVITGMLEDHFTVETGPSVADADLYLVEDKLLPRHREDLRSRVAASHPTFCPVVLIRRDPSTSLGGVNDDTDDATPLLVDEFVDAPLDRGLLVRRLRSLLIRRRQSEELAAYVTTLEERERDLRRFERAVEDTGNAIALLDTDGTVRYVNSAFEETTGYPADDAVGGSLRLLRSDEITFDDAFWRTMRGRGSWEGELVAERRDGTQYVADATITTISTADGDVEGFVAVLRDITERIRREQTLREREEELDLLRQVLTRYLRHNLRNDLNVVLGYAEDIRTSTSGETAAHAETIVEKTNRLLETSDTARRYSTLIERGEASTQHDLVSIVADAVAEVREAYPDATIEVDLPESCPIVAGGGIRTVVAGLVENAAKHNDGPDPWVGIRLRGADRPTLTIEDNGPGIPKHDLRAFNAGHESPLTHSSGIGVWLSKWVIEGAGGELSFDTGPEGTVVTVEFPGSETPRSGGIDVTDLKAREQRLRTIIDRMTDAVLEVDGSWRVTFLDTHAEDVLGVDADEVVDRDFWAAFPNIVGTEFESVYREAMETRSSDRVEAYYGPIDGWLEVYVYPDFDGGLSFYFRDISERKAREQELEHRQRTLRAVYEIIADRDRTFTEQVEALLELGRTELGTDFGSLSRIDGDDYVFEIVEAPEGVVEPGDTVPLSATNCEVAAAEERTLVLGDIARDAPELTDRAGYTDWGVSCYVGAPVFVDSEVYGTFCFYDTEPRADQFSEWEVTLVDLMSRWVSYGLQAQRARERVARENERLDRFASVVSHDLRNPLSVAAGYVRLARETGDTAHLDRAGAALDRMHALVDDLLELARSDETDPDTEVVDLRDAVERSWEVVPTDAATLEVDTDRRIRANPTMLGQLLENLFRNSVEHGSTGDRAAPDEATVHGSNKVTVTVEDLPGGFAVFDDGSGIPAADREAVFEVGYTTGDDGTGFGLPIVREVADAHGWEVTLTDGERGGARYEITGVEVVDD